MRRIIKLPVLIAVVALIGGTGVMALLLSMQNSKASSAIQETESALRVEALRVHPAHVPVVIEGHGQVHVRKTVRIAPEVSGRVVSIHPNLIAGGRVPAGEPLFQIDDQPYKALVADAQGTVAQLEAAVSRLREESKNEQARLESLQRARDIALAQFERLKELFAEDVGTRTGVDVAEAEYVAARDEADKLTHQLGLYPIRIDEAQCALGSARSRLELARLNLEKTRVICPFDARVKERSIEKDQYAVESVEVVELADDSVLEIPVPLDSRDARRWLRFRNPSAGSEAMWFGAPEPVECAVHWTEDDQAARW
ncbi:MAG: biotin/lipoyl-binding protein, partial [Candidatus Hydrogenedentes bacterium]|nr:biotin/lipoyl-binding protein [Candidatus Hydrogenedentota bacterium]